jgi:GMP synthase (glutamine-hydrolysing)
VKRRILIVKTGTAEAEVRRQHGDFEDWIARGLGAEEGETLVADVAAGAPLPATRDISGVVVTGSPSMVSRPDPWTRPTGAWLRDVTLAGMPVLGICYGHQLLAEALGGRVGPNPRGREIGTVRVKLTDAAHAEDPLLGRLSQELVVHATHVESVLELPDGAVHLASTEAEPNHAFSFGRAAWGVQFHPEFGDEMMRGYLEQRAELLREEGLDPELLISQVARTPHGTAVLRRFREIVIERSG